jgi:cytoskeletal protein RodZ
MDEYYGSYPVGPSRKQVILRLAIGVAALLIIGIIIVWLIFFHHKSPEITSKVGKVETSQQTGKSGSNTTGSTSSQAKNKSSSGSSSLTGGTSDTHSSSKSGTSPTARGSNKPATNSNSKPSSGTSSGDRSADLSQTGPGSVLGLFALTVVLAAGLRRWQLSRR